MQQQTLLQPSASGIGDASPEPTQTSEAIQGKYLIPSEWYASNSTYNKLVDPQDILVSNTSAMMTKDAFDKLSEYSTTLPTGVVPGKMWKKRSTTWIGEDGVQAVLWMLGWYGYEVNERCSINFREIVIFDWKAISGLE